MDVLTTEIPGLLVLRPKVFTDFRGYFMEQWSLERFQRAGLMTAFVQDNASRSKRGCIRGLHFQRKFPQGKLIQVVRGTVWDVAVDLRRDSPTFGRWNAIELSDENHLQFYLPPGMAHGLCALSEQADLIYKCTDYYHPEDEAAIRWNDPDLAIKWPISDPVLSEKDARAPFMAEQSF